VTKFTVALNGYAFIINFVYSSKYRCIFNVVIFRCQFIFTKKLVNCIDVIYSYFSECLRANNPVASTKRMPAFSRSFSGFVRHRLSPKFLSSIPKDYVL